MGKKHKFVWDGRKDRGEDARLSIMAGRVATDLRLTLVHFRILSHLGRFNHKKGWCQISQKDLADMFGIHRRTINGAVKQLVKWQYLEKKSQHEAGDSFCLYRPVIDRLDDDGSASGSGDDTASGGEKRTSHSPDTTRKAGVSTTDLTPPEAGVRSRDLTSEISRISPVRSGTSHSPEGAYRLRARVDHVDHVDKKEKDAKPVEDLGIDAIREAVATQREAAARAEIAQCSAEMVAGERLPFIPDVLREIASLGVDVATLVEDYAAKTQGRSIKDPNAYLLKMGRQAAAKLHGVTAETLKTIATRDPSGRGRELAAAVGISAEPSAILLRAAARTAKRWGDDPDAFLCGWRQAVAHRRFASVRQADASLEAYTTHRRFAPEAAAMRRQRMSSVRGAAPAAGGTRLARDPWAPLIPLLARMTAEGKDMGGAP